MASSKVTLVENYYQQLQGEVTNRRILRVLMSHTVEEFLQLSRMEIISLPHLGVGTVDALVDLQNQVKAFINDVMGMTDQHANRRALRETYNLNDQQLLFHEQEGRLPMFGVAFHHIKGLVSERNWEIAIQKFPILQHSKIRQNRELGETFGIDEERVRQIAAKFKENFSELTFNSEDWQWYYDTLLEGKDYVEITGDTQMGAILKQEGSQFTELFAWSILQSVFSDEYTFVGGLYDHMEKNWDRVFLVKRDVAGCFDYDLLRNDMLERCSVEEKAETCKITSLAYNQRYLKMIPSDFGVIKELIVKVIEDIEGLSIDGDEIKFRESRKASDILYEILKERNNPMKLDELYSELLKKDPNTHYSAPGKIRNVMQTDPRFGAQGKESLFTLSEWTHVYSGSKKSAVVYLIQNNGGPMRLDELVAEINRLFPLSPTDEAKMELTYSKLKGQIFKLRKGVWGLVGRDDR